MPTPKNLKKIGSGNNPQVSHGIENDRYLKSALSRMADEKEILGKIYDANQEHLSLTQEVWQMERSGRESSIEESERLDEELSNKKARLAALDTDIKRLVNEDLSRVRQDCTYEEVVAVQQHEARIESDVRKLIDMIGQQQEKLSAIHEEPTAHLETEIEDLHAALALGRITASDHAASVETVQSRINDARESNAQTSREAGQIKAAIAGLRRQLASAENDFQAISDAASRARKACLEADAMSLVKTYMSAAQAVKDAFIRLEGMDKVLADAGVHFRILPYARGQFFLIHPIPAGGSDQKPAIFHADNDMHKLLDDARENESLRIRLLGIHI